MVDDALTLLNGKYANDINVHVSTAVFWLEETADFGRWANNCKKTKKQKTKQLNFFLFW